MYQIICISIYTFIYKLTDFITVTATETTVANNLRQIKVDAAFVFGACAVMWNFWRTSKTVDLGLRPRVC